VRQEVEDEGVSLKDLLAWENHGVIEEEMSARPAHRRVRLSGKLAGHSAGPKNDEIEGEKTNISNFRLGRAVGVIELKN